MKRVFLATVLSGALIGFCGIASADTTDNSGDDGAQQGRRNFGERGGERGGRGNWGGDRGGRGNWGGGRGNWGGGRGNWGGGRGMGGGMFARSARESEIQAKFPEEYAAVAKQLIEAEKKLQDLAKKAKVELPADTNSAYRELRLKDAAGFAEAEKLLKSRETMRQGMEKIRELAKKHDVKLPMPPMMGRPGQGGPGGQGGPNADGPRMRDNNPRQIRLVREKFPEEFKKVTELRQAGKRQEAEELLRDLMRRAAPPRAPRD